MCGQTDGHGETNMRFSWLCERPKNCRCVLSSKNTPTSNDMRNWSFSLGGWFSSQNGWHFLKVSVALQLPVFFVCPSPYCQHDCVYVCIYICWVTKVACVKSDSMNGHDDVEFHRRKTLKLCRTMLHRFEVGFAQELNLYLHICM